MKKQSKNITTDSKSNKLRLFNTGRVYVNRFKGYHVYVAAKSMAQAAKLVSMAFYDGRDDLVPVSEVKTYYNKDAWGNRMEGINPVEPCVYMCDESNFTNKPFRVV